MLTVRVDGTQFELEDRTDLAVEDEIFLVEDEVLEDDSEQEDETLMGGGVFLDDTSTHNSARRKIIKAFESMVTIWPRF